MVLYILFNADLLECLALLNDEDAIGYVNDTMAIAFGNNFEETTTILEHMMTRDNGGFAWSLAHNLCFEISKLAVLHVSQRTQQDPKNPRKRVPLYRPPLRLWDKMIKEVESYKYLGVHIDLQLRWNIQAQKGVANATNWVLQFHRLTRISTGIGIKLMRQLYVTVALPKMTYTLDVWYTPPTKPVGQRKSIGSVGVLCQMTKLQRLASLAIVGGMKSTPTDLLDAHAGLFPIKLTLLHICHRAAVQLCTLPAMHPLHPLVKATHRSQNETQSKTSSGSSNLTQGNSNQ